jgi:multiple sugar transport system substrate-binding protein
MNAIRFVRPLPLAGIFILVLLVLTGAVCKSSIDPRIKPLLEPKVIEWWGVWEDNDDVKILIDAYRQLHPNITINYTKVRYEDFEEQLKEAWLRNTGPDLVMLPNSWIHKYADLLAPAPEVTRSVTSTVEKQLGIKNEVVYKLVESPTPPRQQIEEQFIDVVADDVYVEDKLYGLPLNMDTMVMFFNKDLLDTAGIPLPPRQWSDFVTMIPRLTTQDAAGNILQSGAAMGTSSNVSRSVDLLSLLMMQNGTTMYSEERHRVEIDLARPDAKDSFPGIEALEFYTDFASPAKEVYAWNAEKPDSLEAFSAGTVGFFFGYAYHIPILEAQSTKVNWDVAPVPQTDLAVQRNFANYWAVTVAANSDVQNEAWDFIKTVTQAQMVKPYLDATLKPTALRSLIDPQRQEQFDLVVFLDQLLTAKSWYHGKQPLVMEEAMKEMVDTVVNGTQTPKEAIRIAKQKIEATYQ